MKPYVLLPSGLLLILSALTAAAIDAIRSPTGSPPPAAAADPAQPRTVTLTVHPMAAPDLALSVRLLPGLLDRKAGNAAQYYYRALGALPRNYTQEHMEKVNQWLGLKPAELPKDEVERTLQRFQGALRETATAARHQQCHWEMPLEDGFSMLLPGLSDFRNLGRLLCLRARLQIAEGKLTEALATFQTGFALGRDVGQGPTLIQLLTGVAISRQMLEALEQLVQQDQAPNLYWALTALPRPFADLRAPIEMEGAALYLQFPQLRDLDHTRLSVDQAARLCRKFLTMADGITMVDGSPTDPLEVPASFLGLGMALALYPEAKEALIRQGHARDWIESLPTAQVVLMYQMLIYQRYSQDRFKWFHIPYHQAQAGLVASTQRMVSELDNARGKLSGWITFLMLPALERAFLRATQLDRDLAALRCVEAIRLHAAQHQGKPPGAPQEITTVPFPVDPVTGQPFAYRVEDGKAIVEGVVPPSGKARDGVRYVISLQP